MGEDNQESQEVHGESVSRDSQGNVLYTCNIEGQAVALSVTGQTFLHLGNDTRGRVGGTDPSRPASCPTCHSVVVAFLLSIARVSLLRGPTELSY